MSMPIPIASQALVLVLSAAPADQRYLPTTVEVDVEPLVEQSPAKDREQRELERVTSERTGTRVRDGVRQALEQHGVPIRDAGAAASVIVRLEWKVYLDSHYVARVVARREDGTEQEITLECRLCDEPKLAAAVAERVPEVLPGLEVAAVPSEEPPPTSVETPSPPGPTTVGPGDGEVHTVEARKLGPVGGAGIAALVLGGGATIWGVTVLVEDPVVRPRPDDDHVGEIFSRRPLGVGLTAAGVSLLVTGVVALVVDQTVLRKRRERRQADAALLPSVSRAGAGLTLTGRF